MIALDDNKRRKLIGAARLLSSDKGGEAVAALAAIQRLLPEGQGIADLLERGLSAGGRERKPATYRPSRGFEVEPHQWLASWALGNVPDLNEWEVEFLGSIQHYRKLSDKQRSLLHRIAGRGPARG